jgi:DNA polymerase III epsilon subunit-like protein
MTIFCLDLVTNGLEKTSKIVEIACIELDEKNEQLDWFETLVNPGEPVLSGVHGINDAMVKYASNEKECLTELFSLLVKNNNKVEDITIVAHNAKQDRAVLESACKRNGIMIPQLQWICTLRLARNKWVKKNCSLKKCVERTGSSSNYDFCRAIGNAKACETVYKYLSSGAATFHSSVAVETLDSSEPNETIACVAAAVCGNYFMDPLQMTKTYGLCDACSDALDYYYTHSNFYGTNHNQAYIHCIDVLTHTNAALTLLLLSNSKDKEVNVEHISKKRKV